MFRCWWPRPSIQKGFARSWGSAEAPRRTNPAGRHFCVIWSTAASKACSWSFLTPAEAFSRASRISCRKRATNAAWCISIVPSTRVREVSHMLKAIHAQESREAADTKAKAIVDDLRASKMSKAADLVEQAVHETLTYYGFPDIHWQKIRTNNPLERIMREIRRRTRVVGAFPDGQSCLNLAAARLRYIAGTTWSAKCYMNMRPLYQQQISETEAVA